MKINKGSVFYTTMILGLSSVLMQIFGFVYRIFLNDLAGTEALGIYKLTMQVYTVMLTVCTAGVCLVSTNKSASFYAVGNTAKIRKTINACLTIFLGIFIIFSVFLVIFDDFVALKILGDIRTKQALYILILCIFLTGIENIIKNSLIGIKKVKYTVFSEIIEQIIRITVVIWLLYNFSDGDYGKIAFLIILGMTISEVFSIVFLKICYEKIYKTNRKCTDKVLMDTAKVALPISLAAVVNNIISSASTVVLPSRLVKAGLTQSQALSQLGIISSVAMPILIFPIAVISAYTLVIMPNISKSRAQSDYKNITRKISKSIEATGYIGIPATVGLVYLSRPLGRILFRIDFPPVYMEMLGICVVFTYYQIVSASILNGLGREKNAVFHSVIGEVVQLVITVTLCSISYINIYGYVLGMIISPVIVTSLNMTYVFKNEDFSFKKYILKPSLCGIILFFAMKSVYQAVIMIVGSQVTTVFVTLFAGIFVYFVILRLVGIDYFAYMKNLNVKVCEKYK